MQHMIDVRGGQLGNCGKSIYEPHKIRNNGYDLGLLQHDLGNPHPIGSGLFLPGQIVSAVDIEPGKYLVRKIWHCF